MSEPFSDSKKVTPKMSHKPVELHAISDDPEKTKVVEKMSNGTANGDVSGLDDKNVVISMQTEAVEFSGKKCFEVSLFIIQMGIGRAINLSLKIRIF